MDESNQKLKDRLHHHRHRQQQLKLFGGLDNAIGFTNFTLQNFIKANLS